MSATRKVMMGTGGGLLLLSLSGALARLSGVGPLVVTLANVPSPALFGAAGAVGVIGLLLVSFAPPSRRAERRVTLDRHDGPAAPVIRPGESALPRTVGFGTAEPRPAAPYAGVGQAAVVLTRPEATGHVATGAWSGNGHPNDPTAEARPTLSGRAVDPAAVAAVAAAAARDRPGRRRAELMHRLELLDLKANNAKVNYGLGKISAAGYKQYLKEVDSERTLIESELMETEPRE